MKPFLLLLFCLALLPCVSAGWIWNSDTNSVVWDENVSDANAVDLNTGPIQFKLTFAHTVIGEVTDFNELGLIFSENADYAFDFDLPSLTNFYFLDFSKNEVRTYVEGIVPDGWQPMVTLHGTSMNFRVNNLIGGCDPDLFILVKNEDGLRFEHLEVGEWITLASVKESKFFLLVDIDEYGLGSFSLDFEEFEIGVSLNFRKIPKGDEWIEEFGVSCEDSPNDICILYPDGSSWNYTACMDAGSELNQNVGEAPGSEICIQGNLAHESWFVETLVRQKKKAEDDAAEFKKKTDPELVTVIDTLVGKFEGIEQREQDANLSAEEGLNEFLLALIVVAVGIFGFFVMSRKSLPMQAVTHFGSGVKEKILEVSENVRKKEGKGKGEKGSEGSGEGQGGGVAGPEGDRAEGRVEDEFKWW